MQQEELIGLMKGSIPYTRETLSGLSDLIEKYPYFQTARFLHTLNLLQLKDAHFLYDLRKTAIIAPDRKQLFFRIEDDLFDPKLIHALEKEKQPTGSSFELIENFLSATGEKSESLPIEPESSPVPADYVSYFLSDQTKIEETQPFRHQATIDKFLEEDTISPVKIKLNPSDDSGEELSKPALDSPVEPGFFSETLAKIYIKQKKYKMALEIIRKLNLLYPEKSRYFADQIRFLEKLIIYTNKIR